MKFAAIEAEKARYPIEFMCGMLGVSRSGFYAWLGRPQSERALADVRLGVEVAAAHEESKKRYGSPRVHAELKARGHRLGRKRVARLMRERQLRARPKRRWKRTTDSNHRLPVAPNLLERDFKTSEPNQVWVADITYVWTREGWLYLAAILDLYARRVVGWAVSEQIDTELCLSALRMALRARRPAPGLVHHSDRGSQYASRAYRAALDEAGLRCSMSRKGDCWDNAPAESFWSTLKAELVELTTFDTRAQAGVAVAQYIELFYNRQRRHSVIDYRSPAEYESICNQVRLAA